MFCFCRVCCCSILPHVLSVYLRGNRSCFFCTPPLSRDTKGVGWNCDATIPELIIVLHSRLVTGSLTTHYVSSLAGWLSGCLAMKRIRCLCLQLQHQQKCQNQPIAGPEKNPRSAAQVHKSQAFPAKPGYVPSMSGSSFKQYALAYSTIIL